MNIEDKAHEYAKILLNHTMSEHGRLSVEDAFNIAETAHILADAMLEIQGKKPVTRPAVLEDWQPDWSQAPDWAKWWCVAWDDNQITGGFWADGEPELISVPGGYFGYSHYGRGEFSPSFGYTGDWRDSLRMRPEGG